VRERERERLRYNFQTPFLLNFHQANTTERDRERVSKRKKRILLRSGKKYEFFSAKTLLLPLLAAPAHVCVRVFGPAFRPVAPCRPQQQQGALRA